MHDHHIHTLITRYVHGQLNAAQRAHVVNHVRLCVSCRAALAREERVAADLRREMPVLGQPGAGQMASLWAGVWQEIRTPSHHPAWGLSAMWLPGLSLVMAAVLVLTVALPLLDEDGVHAEAAPLQPRPISTASPTPGLTETGEARLVNVAFSAGLTMPQATVAYAQDVGATPAPVPALTVSPEAWRSGAQWR